MYNCIIVDDQVEAIKIIDMHIRKIPQLNLVNTFTSSIEALNYLKNSEIDLIFLDVQMSDLNGFEVIDNLANSSGYKIPSLILTTGYSEYALQGYDYRVVDFLLKPIIFKRFKISIDKFIESKTYVVSNELNQPRDYFFIDSDGAKLKLNYDEIIYVESENNCIKIIEKRVIRTINKPLHYIENILCNHKDFVRVHKSFLISLNYVESIRASDVILKIGDMRKTISIGSTYKENFLKKINSK
jgi:DNA-binding LytR/AlgR family response regulator